MEVMCVTSRCRPEKVGPPLYSLFPFLLARTVENRFKHADDNSALTEGRAMTTKGLEFLNNVRSRAAFLSTNTSLGHVPLRSILLCS
jgi:hypothetical protein